MISHLESLDYIAVAVYIALMALIGLYIGVFVKDVGAYFKGGSAIPWQMSAVSNFMGLFSTFVFVAYAGIAYEHGLISITIFWATVPACIIGGLCFAGRWRRTGQTSPMEFLEERYNLPVRQLFTWIGMVMRFLDNMIRLYAIGVFITVVTPLSLESSIVVSGIIVTVFNIIGGVWSVVIMSTVQFFILLLATFILVPLSLDAVGGLSALSEKLPEHMTWFNGPKGTFLWLLVYYIMTLIKYNENWTFIQKFYSVRDEKAARKVGVWTGIMFLVFTPLFILPAVTAQLLTPGLPDPEMAYVAVSKYLLPAGIMGILFSSMFAATMSSLNSEYNIMSAVLTKDIYQRLFNPEASEKKLLFVARLSTGLIGAVMIIGAIYVRYMGGAFEANKLLTGIVAIPLGIPFILGIVVKKPGVYSSILSISGGILAGIVLNAMPAIPWEWATLIEIVICLVLYFAPTLFMEKVEIRSHVRHFFEQMNTPIKEEDKPVITAEYKRAIILLFAISIIIAGILFVGVSIPSLKLFSGQLSFGAGCFCFLCAGLMWWYVHRNKNKKI